MPKCHNDQNDVARIHHKYHIQVLNMDILNIHNYDFINENDGKGIGKNGLDRQTLQAYKCGIQGHRCNHIKLKIENFNIGLSMKPFTPRTKITSSG